MSRPLARLQQYLFLIMSLEIVSVVNVFASERLVQRYQPRWTPVKLVLPGLPRCSLVRLLVLMAMTAKASFTPRWSLIRAACLALDSRDKVQVVSNGSGTGDSTDALQEYCLASSLAFVSSSASS